MSWHVCYLCLRSIQGKSTQNHPLQSAALRVPCAPRTQRVRSTTRRSELRSRCSLVLPRARHVSLLRDGIADPRDARVPIPATHPRSSPRLGRPPTASKAKARASRRDGFADGRVNSIALQQQLVFLRRRCQILATKDHCLGCDRVRRSKPSPRGERVG